MASSTLAEKPSRLQLGPRDFGRRLTEPQFMKAAYEPGYRYELIEGRLYVVTLPLQVHDWIEKWLLRLLQAHTEKHPEIINRATDKAVVYVPGMTRTTRPEPDIVAYQNFPLERGPRVRWQDISPVLVIEILSEGGLEKDLNRNVALYARVSSIREYWIIDGLTDPERPTMIVRRRKGKSWQIENIDSGETYTTKLLPGFELKLDTRASHS
jgi:Uma2 family endonuclease